jgi:hypothetical protein
MEPNWTICVVSALIDVLQNTIYSLNLHEIWLKLIFPSSSLSNMVSNRGLWNTRWSRRSEVVGSQAAARKRRRMLDTAWLAFYSHRAAKLNIAESNLIWVAKKPMFVVALDCWMFNLEGKLWMCKAKCCTTAISRLQICRVSTPKEICRRLSDYKFHIHSLYRQLFIAKIHCHRAPKKRQWSKLSK